MKKLLIILFAILHLQAHSQTPAMTGKLLTSLPSYQGLNGGFNLAFLEFIPPDAKAKRAGTGHLTQKFPIIINLAGREGQTQSFTTGASVTTAELSVLYSRTPTSLLQYTTSSLVNKRYAAPGRTDSTQFIFLCPQVWGGANGRTANPQNRFTQRWYIYHMLRYIKANLLDIADTNRIYLTGLSQGAGGVNVGLQDPVIFRQIAAGYAGGSGYITYGGLSPAYGFDSLAIKWGGLLILAHAIDDSTTDKNPVTRVGSWYSDRINDSIIKYKGITTVFYARYVSGDHFASWDRAYNPATWGVAYPKTNLNNVTWTPSIFSLFLQYSTGGRRNVVP